MPIQRNIVKRNFYKDSIQLLAISESVRSVTGITDAAVVMGTPINKQLLKDANLLTREGEESTNEDTIIALSAVSEESIQRALDIIERELSPKTDARRSSSPSAGSFPDIESALASFPEANYALISVPGPFVRDIAEKFLRRGLHVQIFSDHVSIEDEAYLKKHAIENHLLVLGPSAGTCLIGGKSIAFANVVDSGRVGIVAASGTGLQEISVLLTNSGVGISQGLGVGGRDMTEDVGGAMTLSCIEALESDHNTDVICVVSKKPSDSIFDKILKFVGTKTKKNYVLSFMGTSKLENDARLKACASPRIAIARSLQAAAVLSARFSLEKARIANSSIGSFKDHVGMNQTELESLAKSIYQKLKPNQRYIRGLYSGGTLMAEAAEILSHMVGDVFSNVPLKKEFFTSGIEEKSDCHSLLDLGEELFTKGRAHPMIDPTIRKMKLVSESKDQTLACIMLDVILGYGCNEDPASTLSPSIKQSINNFANRGAYLPVLIHVCGTKHDPQDIANQESILRESGAILVPTNADMAVLAGLISSRGMIKESIFGSVLEEFLCL